MTQKNMAWGAMAVALGLSGLVYAQPAKEKKAAKSETVAQKPAHKGKKEHPWRLAVMTYTFNRFTLFEAIDKAKKAGAKYIETFSWQKIGDKHGDMQFNPAASDEALEAVKHKLVSDGMSLTGLYYHDLGKSEADARKVFSFCKKMAIETIICEPQASSLEMVDKLATEHKIKVAIHNHPKDSKKPEYTNWNPESVMKMIEGRSKWIGTCADNGHWVRSGLDPIECIKKYKGRLISLHLKDVNTVGPDAHDVPYGDGVVDLKGLFAQLRRQKFTGVFSIEYENNMENNMPDVEKCIAYFDKVTQEPAAK